MSRLRVEDLPADRLCLAVFGPGHGEAALLRFPDGSIGVVDGCGEGPRNPVLGLLSGMPAARLRFVALTHPHEDHLMGMAEVIREFRPEEVWFGGADHPRMYQPIVRRLRRAEHRTAAEHDAAAPPRHKRLADLVNQMVGRRRTRWGALQSLGDRQLHVDEADCRGHRLRVRSLLPTTTSRFRAWRHHRTPATSAAPVETDIEQLDADVNDLSAVLLIEWGDTRILLGGDAEVGGQGRGWTAADVPDRIDILKVPHHASSGAFHQPTWERLRTDVAIVTPYMHAAGSQPPQPAGLDSFAKHARRLFVTSPPDWHRPRPPLPTRWGGLTFKPDRFLDNDASVLVTADHASNCDVRLFGGAFQYK